MEFGDNYGERTNGESFAKSNAGSRHSQVYPHTEPSSPIWVPLPAEGIRGNFVYQSCPQSSTVIFTDLGLKPKELQSARGIFGIMKGKE